MNDETKMVISHEDLCRAVELWLETKVLRFSVTVSSVAKESEYGLPGFKLMFQRTQNAEKGHDGTDVT